MRLRSSIRRSTAARSESSVATELAVRDMIHDGHLRAYQATIPVHPAVDLMDYSKTEKRALRQLVAEAYRRELSRALKVLSQAFRDWESGVIDCHELNERIHRYHQEDARAIWSRYNSLPSILLVAAGVHSGVLTMEDIPAPFRERVLVALETFSEVAPPSSKPDSEAH